MPIYEYECKKCGERFEVLQGFNDDSLKRCGQIFKILENDEDYPKKPEICSGRAKVEKLISLSAFHLKGSGWYETDHGKKKISHEKQLRNQTDSPTENGNGSTDVGSSPSPPNTEPKQVYNSIKSDTKQAKKKAQPNLK